MGQPGKKWQQNQSKINLLLCICLLGSACSVEPDETTDSGAFVGFEAELPETSTGGIPVPLPNGLTGEFFAATCGATCGDSTIHWQEKGVAYAVGENVGTGARLLDLAWQTIDETATPPARPEVCGPDTIRDQGRAAAVIEDEETGLHWVSVCSEQGISSALAVGYGSLTWVEIDGDHSNDLELNLGGRSSLFTVSEDNQIYPLWGVFE